MRRTKILATVGPATGSPAQMAHLLEAGADGFRLNFSHGSDDEHRALLRAMREAARRTRREPAIVADVQGPKIRLGDLIGGSVTLSVGQAWTLDQDPRAGDGRRVGVALPSFATAARPGDPVILGDGNVELEVRHASSRAIETVVTNGGRVGAHAGLFLPRAHLRTSVLGPKDRADARIAAAEGADFLALSFVRDARDLSAARRWLDRVEGGARMGLIAKIERAEALAGIDGILAASDGIMVARGDLGIEVPLERLALEQKRLVRAANVAGRFVIVATQMLLSMLSAPRPTRAEATDVANAVLDGADAVMLSEESAVGAYPIDAVRWLARIATATEPAFDPLPLRAIADASSGGRAGERSVAAAAVELAERTRATAIVTPTHSGRTARLVAALRPACPVLALARDDRTRRQLALVSGVRAVSTPVHRTLEDLRRASVRVARAAKVLGDGPLVLTAGYPIEGRPTNLVTRVDVA
ncbi:MAG TPA: pyruvate kinase [Thermoplasmata archaeon]|jgi:pyruvate kinase|nr:pyruvate kinase [Thermoplasmata archaeon]